MLKHCVLTSTLQNLLLLSILKTQNQMPTKKELCKNYPLLKKRSKNNHLTVTTENSHTFNYELL